MTRSFRALAGLLLLALVCQLAEGALHAVEHGHVHGLPPASGQQEAHAGDCHHGVDLGHESHADCLSCSSRTVAQASNHEDEIVLSTLRPDTLAVPAEVPPTAVLPGGTLGARGPPAIAG